eukprot:9273051-Pyramimonas_sp.AAC.1
MSKARRLLRLKRAGAKVAGIVNTNLRPTVMYGIDVAGLSSHQIRQVRTIYHAGLGTGKRRSVTMDLALHGVTDPAIDAHAE